MNIPESESSSTTETHTPPEDPAHQLSDQALRGKWMIKGILILGLGFFGLLSGLPMINGQTFHSASLSPVIVFFAFWMGVWLGHQWARYVLAAILALIGGYQIFLAIQAFTSGADREAMLQAGVTLVPFTLTITLLFSNAIGIYQRERNIQRWGHPSGKPITDTDTNADTDLENRKDQQR